jgi:hypothetical protein
MFDIILRLLLPDNRIKRTQKWPKLISTRGITFTGISQEKANHLKKLLEVESAIVSLSNTDFDDSAPHPDNGKKPFMVLGVVKDSDGKQLAGLTIEAYDKDMQSEELLDKYTTDVKGEYQIIYFTHQFRRAEIGTADIILKVKGIDSSTLVTSDVLFNAPQEAIINLVVSSAFEQSPSEWEQRHNIIKPLRKNAEVVDLTDEDLEFISREAEIAPEHLLYQRFDAHQTGLIENSYLPDNLTGFFISIYIMQIDFIQMSKMYKHQGISILLSHLM